VSVTRGSEVRVELPTHLRTLAEVEPQVVVRLAPGVEATVRAVFDALEAEYPGLRGTIRDRSSGARRAYMRYFTGREDWSHESPDAPLPDAVARGAEPLRVVGAIAGG
jgi:molybdopterin converting factor small subunit